MPDSPFTNFAVPRGGTSPYGAGIDRGLCLGGGGLFFVAWQVSYLHTLASQGVDVRRAERVVGTSAGSLVATMLTGGHLGRMHSELSLLMRFPSVVSAMVPADDLRTSQLHALGLFFEATDSDPDTIRSIGHAALAAETPPSRAMRRTISLVVGRRQWPSPSLHITCVDAYSGERCIVTHRSSTPVSTAVAASSAVPGLFAPQRIQGRLCMDGGVSGSGTHLDLLAGARKVMVLALTDDTVAEKGMMTAAPDGLRQELDQLEATGTRVFLRAPKEMDIEQLMSPSEVGKAVAMGRTQALADVQEVTNFWD